MYFMKFFTPHLLLTFTLSWVFHYHVGCYAMAPSSTSTYRYFAYGSNVASATMTALRQIEPIESKAAILPNYKLRFNIPGTPLVEPSWACVEPCDAIDDSTLMNQNNVHGVLYTLSEDDFAKVGRSEGVPFGYRWQRCQVFPYIGDGKKAGCEALSQKAVPAYTLVSSFLSTTTKKDIPPSRAYRDLIVRGAREWMFDENYLKELQSVPVGRTIGNGIVAGEILQVAEMLEKIRGKRKR